ncbi:archease [Patescibacteria group bacterium]|nr:archease [Patescibacteria group bacterium]MBU1682939.1 archease [Patescibacteria group bacterium]
MKPFTFRSNIAIADIAFYAYGKTPEQLIINACHAVTEAMVRRDKIGKKEKIEFSKKSETLEDLLYSVLEEIIYLKDAKQLVFHNFKIKEIQTDQPPYLVKMEIAGEKIDHKKHESHSDVKAVTYYDYYVEKTGDGYKASVILDV